MLKQAHIVFLFKSVIVIDVKFDIQKRTYEKYLSELYKKTLEGKWICSGKFLFLY